MNTKHFFNDIFLESNSEHISDEHSFLDIAEFLWTGIDTSNRVENIEESHPESHPFFEVSVTPEEAFHESLSNHSMEKESTLRKSKCVGKSVYNKNVCFNICQKTIKTIKKGQYQDKLLEICEYFGIHH
jgi:hypothetical protein